MFTKSIPTGVTPNPLLVIVHLCPMIQTWSKFVLSGQIKHHTDEFVRTEVVEYNNN